MINKHRYIATKCQNFYTITNHYYQKEDYITDKIINIYRSFLNNISLTRSNIAQAKKLDIVVTRYIKDQDFHKELKTRFPYIEFITNENIVNSIVEQLISIYDTYLEGCTKRIHIARWI